MGASFYIAVLDWCIDAKDQGLTEKLFSGALASGTADAASYDTIIKWHLHQGDIETALTTVGSMRSQVVVLARSV